MNTFEDVKQSVQLLEMRLKNQNYMTVLDLTPYAYRLKIDHDNHSVTVRDGYLSDTEINTKPVEITSFEAFFTISQTRFAYYMSDYPLSEYPTRLQELEVLIGSFFNRKYLIEQDRYLLLWKKRYLNIELNDEVLHFMEIK